MAYSLVVPSPSVPSSRKNINQRFTNYLAPKCYNLLPVAIRLTKNKKKFKIMSKKYIVDHYNEFMKILKP